MKKLLLIFALYCVPAFAVSVTPIVQPRVSFVDNSGAPCSGCFLYTYIAGTTTPLATYTDSGGVSQNTNPVVLDPSGSAVIWLGSTAYKFVLVNSLGATLWTVDNIVSSSGYMPITGGTFTGAVSGSTATFTTLNGTNETLTGTLTAPTVNATNLNVPNLNATAISSSAVSTNALNVIAEGDSLTFAYYPTMGTYPYFLSGLTQFPVQNMGSDGNSSTGICILQGACTAKTTAPLTMPTCPSGSCTGVAVSFTPANPMSDPRGPMPIGAIIASMTAVGGHVITGTYSVISGTPTFTPLNANGETIATNTNLVVTTSSRQNGIQLIWAGRNDAPLATSPSSGNFTTTVQNAIVANIHAMVCNNPYNLPALVFDITPISSPNEAATSVEGGQLTTIKNTLSTGAGQSISCTQGYTRTYSFFDVWGYLQGFSSGDLVDTSDVTNGYVPTSLHAQTTSGTLSGGINNSVTSLSYVISSGSGCPTAGNILRIDTSASEESMLVVSSTGTTTCAVTVTRGFGGNTTSHSDGVAIQVFDQTHFNAAANKNIATYVNSWLTGQARVPVIGGLSSNALPMTATGVFAPTSTCAPSGITVNGGYAPCTVLSAQYAPFIWNGVSSTIVPISQLTPSIGGNILQFGVNGYTSAWVQSTSNGAGGLLQLNPQGGETDLGGNVVVAGSLTAGGNAVVTTAATTTSLAACNNSGSFTACTSTTPTVNTGVIQGANISGYINVTAQTSVTLTFASPTGWSTAVYCTALQDTAGVTVRGTNTGATSFTFTFSGSYSGGIYYSCGGK